MNIINEDIGTAKDNLRMPIHNWYKFTAGFSYKLVEEIINIEKLTENQTIYEPFAGCGTTLVTAQKQNIKSIGNESQKHMFEVIKGKTNWDLPLKQIYGHLNNITTILEYKDINIPIDTQPLLKKLYTPKKLLQLLLIKNYIDSINKNRCYYFLKLALSQTLHKVSKYPIAVPYVSWNKKNKVVGNVKEVFFSLIEKMIDDTKELAKCNNKSLIYKHDSRTTNKHIKDQTCDVCITSPPYLNNLDYGEVSKVHTYFYDYTNDWNDITQFVRKKLVTASTTHYRERDFCLSDWKNTEFYTSNKSICDSILSLSYSIKKSSNAKGGKKSFDILILKYFYDMYKVLVETKRILKKDKPAYIILGDSAPYGIRIPTTEILGQISLTTGFREYSITKIRTRGNKWKGLKHRHNKTLSENLLFVK